MASVHSDFSRIVITGEAGFSDYLSGIELGSGFPGTTAIYLELHGLCDGNNPNPFNPTTTIRYTLQDESGTNKYLQYQYAVLGVWRSFLVK